MEIHIGKRVADITLQSKEGNRLTLLIDGEPREVDVVIAQNGRCSILMDGKSYNTAYTKSADGKNYEVNTYFSSHDVEIVDSQAKYLQMRRGGDPSRQDYIAAPMPGKVVKIPVSEGDTLAEGDIAIVLEAMKMQSNYKVSSPCLVKAINVSEGDTVSAGDRLIELAPIENNE